MKRKATLLLTLESALLAGGYSSPTGFMDATTAVDDNGIPFIPGSMLKGTLREAVTRLARAGGGACTLVEPCPPGATPCIACRLFGSPGTDLSEVLEGKTVQSGGLGALRITDARSIDAQAEGALKRTLAPRHGVGIDRLTRAAAPQVLFQREVADAAGSTLVAHVHADDLSDADWKLFLSALPLATGIGNSRTRGLGRIRIEVVAEDAGARAAPVHALPASAPDDAIGLVVVELLEPVVVGGIPSASGFIQSGKGIPGSAVRGALGNAAASLGMDDSFRRSIVAPGTCLLFSDLLPVKPGTVPDALPVPVPLSSFSCKNSCRHPKERGNQRPRDGLLRAALLPSLIKTRRGSLTPLQCPICKDEELRPARGGDSWPPFDVPTRVVTRLARDVATGASMPGMLYSQEQLEPGTTFAGTVARLTPEALGLVKELSEVPLRIGKGKSRGQGLIRLQVQPARPGVAGRRGLERRVRDFDQHVAPWMPLLAEAAGGGSWDGALAVLARTDLKLDPAACPTLLAQDIFGSSSLDAVCCIATVQDCRQRSGWDQGHGKQPAGPRDLTTVVAAGSSWLFLYRKEVRPDAQHLARLESEGVGAWRELGLGHVCFDHELFLDLE